jgi:hypothetical protein
VDSVPLVIPVVVSEPLVELLSESSVVDDEVEHAVKVIANVPASNKVNKADFFISFLF